MKRCRTKKGELRLRWEDEDYVLDIEGLDLPDELAESIRGHVNVIVDGPPPAPPPPVEVEQDLGGAAIDDQGQIEDPAPESEEKPEPSKRSGRGKKPSSSD